MLEYLLRSEFSKLPQMFKCIELMERHTGDDYELDFIPFSYTKSTDKHNIHFRIAKKQGKNPRIRTFTPTNVNNGFFTTTTRAVHSGIHQ